MIFVRGEERKKLYKRGLLVSGLWSNRHSLKTKNRRLCLEERPFDRVSRPNLFFIYPLSRTFLFICVHTYSYFMERTSHHFRISPNWKGSGQVQIKRSLKIICSSQTRKYFNSYLNKNFIQFPKFQSRVPKIVNILRPRIKT